jgi:hypothetical protein
VDLCPLIEQKMTKKMREFGGKWVSGFMGKNGENRGFEGRKWLGGGLERPAVVRWWWGE